jgi:GNAT superfamily N-acetyltransferase
MTGQTPDSFDAGEVMIRLAEEEDHAVIREMFRKSMAEGQLRGNDTGADIENLREGYFADDGASGFWVASHRGDIIGMIGVQKTRENTAELRRLYVRVGYRRQHVGTLLIEHAIDFCRQQGYLKVILDVRLERSPAIAILQKFGFTHVRTREIDGYKRLDFYLDLYREPKG